MSIYGIAYVWKYQAIISPIVQIANWDAPNLNLPRRNIAEGIVQRAYNATFAHVVKACPKEADFKTCMLKFYKEGVENAPAGNAPPEVFQHWWFRTMVRDAYNFEKAKRGSGLPIRYFHVATASNPNVSMCMIEKIGTKQWKQVFSRVNGKKGFGSFHAEKKHSFHLPASNAGYPSIVFFRDPLQRFLSAYLDKCIGKITREREKHCEPNPLFNPKNQSEADMDLTMGLSFEDHQKEMFAAYVDVMPLTWNLHFFPQSLYCDGIYRFLDDYDFVGYMDAKYYERLDEMGKRYGGKFEEEVNKVFELEKQLNTTNVEQRTSDGGVGKETRAVDKVQLYYTPRTLRRVLEYVSMDYMLLGMDIPEWAEQMLQEDELRR